MYMYISYTRISFEIMQAEIVIDMLCIFCNKSIPFNLVQFQLYNVMLTAVTCLIEIKCIILFTIFVVLSTLLDAQSWQAII